MDKLKFSPENAKTRKLHDCADLQKFLDKRKVYSFDMRAGYTCPKAKLCLSRAVEENGKLSIKDGKFTEFRCFSASTEVVYPGTYRLHKHNETVIRQIARMARLKAAKIVSDQLPKNLGILRWHVSGDFFNQVYFDIAALVARMNPDRLFYAYTKNLSCWVRRLDQLTENLVLTASYGGTEDHLISQENLRSARVILDPAESATLGLPIDKTDELAANPNKRDQDFLLLIHNTQPAGTDAARAWYKIKKTVGGYRK